MNQRILKHVFCILSIFCFLLGAGYDSYGQNQRNVYIIPIEGEINPANAQFINHSIEEAESDPESVCIIFEIDTPGGRVDQAIKIRDKIMSTSVRTISFINNDAQSAGVLLAIASENIVMAHGSSIGSAEPVPNNEKNLSFWKAELRKTAEGRGRDPLLVEAMADRRIEIPDPKQEGKMLVQRGELLNLTTAEAENLDFIDLTANSYREILKKFNIDYTQIIPVEQDLKTKAAKWVTSSTILPFILSAGFIGLVIELFMPGFGLGGTISLIAFSFFFAGSFLAGNASVFTILLFIVGMILLIIEIIMPGFGAPGIGGIICMISSIIFASDSVALGVFSLFIAFTAVVIAIILLIKYGPKNKYLDKIILSTQLKKDKGYIAATDRASLLGREGVAVTKLRPSGMIEVDHEKIDAVTSGEFIEKDSRIKIIRVEGRKIIVKKID